MGRKIREYQEKYHIQEHQISPEEAQNIIGEIKLIQSNITKNFLDIGRHLCMFYWGNGWKACGCDSWRQWLADSDIAIKERHAYNFMALYIEWKERLEIICEDNPQLFIGTPPSKLIMLLPKIRNETDKEVILEWLEKARNLSPQDLKKEIKNEPERAILIADFVITRYYGNKVELSDFHPHLSASKESIFTAYGNKKIRGVFTVMEDE